MFQTTSIPQVIFESYTDGTSTFFFFFKTETNPLNYPSHTLALLHHLLSVTMILTKKLI